MKRQSFLFILLLFSLFFKYTFTQINNISTDSTSSLLAGNSEGEAISEIPPKIDFGIMEVENYGDGLFDHWGNITLGPDHKYYYAISNHMDVCLLRCYDPNTRIEETLLNSEDILSGDEMKWHGRLDINPKNGDMFIVGFELGEVVKYNIYTEQATSYGYPTPGIGYNEHIWDWERELLYGVSNVGEILVYDTKNKNIIHSGLPKDSVSKAEINWFHRARMLDRETGYFYGSDNEGQLMRYNPTSNSFKTMQSKLDQNLRAWTNERDSSSLFWLFDNAGGVYTFCPEEDMVKKKGSAFGSMAYITAIEMDPEKKYLYYSLARSFGDLPVVRYNIKKNTKEIIAFLSPYYENAHDFSARMVYGCALSRNGSSLFVISTSYNHPGPGIFNIFIPGYDDYGFPVSVDDNIFFNENIRRKSIIKTINPNPAYELVNLSIVLNKTIYLNFAIYDIQGHLVRKLGSTEYSKGEHYITWNLKNGNNECLAPGFYFIRIGSVLGYETVKLVIGRK